MHQRLSNVFSIYKYRPIDFILAYFRHLLNENICQHYELEILVDLIIICSTCLFTHILLSAADDGWPLKSKHVAC